MMKQKHVLKQWITGTAIAALSLPIIMPAASHIQMVHAEQTDNFYITKDYFATEQNASAQNKTWQGEYINPHDITSVETISLNGNAVPTQTFDNNLFLTELTSQNKTELSIGLKTDMQDNTWILTMKNYNETGYDLYYQLDTNTGIWYQTLNTKPDDTNAVLHTDTTALDERYGFIYVYHSSHRYDPVQYYTAMEWWLSKDKTLDITLDDINELQLTQIFSFDYNKNPIEPAASSPTVKSEYTLLGTTWLYNESTLIIDRHETNITTSEIKPIVQNEIYIPTNGTKGDKLSIYQSTTAIYVDNTDIDLNDLIKGEYMQYEYTLQKDNESLPVGDGVYVIYNHNTNIYETICATYDSNPSGSEIFYSPECFINQILYYQYNNQTPDFVDIYETYNNIRRPIAANIKKYADITYYTRFAYDKPRTLNISDTEYTDIIVTNALDTPSKTEPDTIVHPHSIRLDNRNCSLEYKIKTANISFKNSVETLTPSCYDSNPEKPYFISTVYQNVPCNTDFCSAVALATTTALNHDLEYVPTSEPYDLIGDQKVGIDTLLFYDETEQDLINRMSQQSNVTPTATYYVTEDHHITDSGGYLQDTCPYTNVEGDVNQDGVFNLTDVVMQQKYLHGHLDKTEYNIANFAAANLYKDENNNIFDLCLLKRLLLSQNQ